MTDHHAVASEIELAIAFPLDAESLHEAIVGVLRRHYGAASRDGAVDEAWLKKRGYSNDGLRGWTRLVPPVCDGGAIITLHVEPPQPEFDAAIAKVSGYEMKRPSEWAVSLSQGMPDDVHYPDDQIVLTGLPGELTRGMVLRVESALGIQSPNQPASGKGG